MTALLYLDFDGVLHPNDVWHLVDEGPVLGEASAGHTLFEHAATLEEALAPYPHVGIVLSTSWARGFGLQYATARLPASLQSRVIGATFDPELHGRGYGDIARPYQVLQDVERRKPATWLALDDDAKDWPDEHRHRLVAADPVLGLGDPQTQATLRQRMAELFGNSFSSEAEL